jgi:hypothetical protein
MNFLVDTNIRKRERLPAINSNNDAANLFTLEKALWTDADFERMNWHDSRIHAVAFQPQLFELWLDVDYIFRWIKPSDERHFQFWVAPATLVFSNVYNLKLDIESLAIGFSIQAIKRSDGCSPRNTTEKNKHADWLWLLECHEGDITFRSFGFTKHIRRLPVLQKIQSLSLEERGGISFARDLLLT